MPRLCAPFMPWSGIISKTLKTFGLEQSFGFSGKFRPGKEAGSSCLGRLKERPGPAPPGKISQKMMIQDKDPGTEVSDYAEEIFPCHLQGPETEPRAQIGGGAIHQEEVRLLLQEEMYHLGPHRTGHIRGVHKDLAPGPYHHRNHAPEPGIRTVKERAGKKDFSPGKFYPSAFGHLPVHAGPDESFQEFRRPMGLVAVDVPHRVLKKDPFPPKIFRPIGKIVIEMIMGNHHQLGPSESLPDKGPGPGKPFQFQTIRRETVSSGAQGRPGIDKDPHPGALHLHSHGTHPQTFGRKDLHPHALQDSRKPGLREVLWGLLFFFLLVSGLKAQKIKAFGLELLWDYPLGDVSFQVRAGHTPDSFVRFSPDGRYLALGTFSGRLLLFQSSTGRILWEKKIPEAMVKRVAFSPQAKILYYGEQGPEGAVCAVKVSSGKTLWCFSTARDLLRGEPPAPGDVYGIYQLPGIYRLRVLPGGDLLVLGVHSWFDRRVRAWRRLSRLYRLSPEGRVRWAYPASGPAPVTIIYADSDPTGDRVALVSLLPSEYPEDLRFPGPPPQSFVALSGETGRETFRYLLRPLRPYFDRVSAWESVAVSPDGRFAALGTGDGRLFLFDLTVPKLSRILSLATPILFGNFPVSATLGYGLFGPRGILYILSGESTLPYGLPLSVDRPAGPHPAARTLFALDPETGHILWRFTSPVRLQGLAVDTRGQTLAVSAAAFRRENLRVRQFGVLVFDLRGRGGGLSRLSGYFPTEGTCFFHLAVSPDGSLIAAVETPWRDELGRLFGKHRLLVLRRIPNSGFR